MNSRPSRPGVASSQGKTKGKSSAPGTGEPKAVNRQRAEKDFHVRQEGQWTGALRGKPASKGPGEWQRKSWSSRRKIRIRGRRIERRQIFPKIKLTRKGGFDENGNRRRRSSRFRPGKYDKSAAGHDTALKRFIQQPFRSITQNPKHEKHRASENLQTNNSSASRTRRPLLGSIAALLLCAAAPAFAGSAQWTGIVFAGLQYQQQLESITVPNSSSDVGTFGFVQDHFVAFQPSHGEQLRVQRGRQHLHHQRAGLKYPHV